ncbi:MAG: iron ABC transporter permease [Tabrizicola sp.]|uniref:ABC transporter permease n=1 Tax=Tabrizicola sp. TaxID=2005166 RepID=UPI0027327CAD|nr:iron ABC transporter permease [Tabrizicola sp.]MDP3263246.1 iron ABC transporter permease [Tabrizicola sp.]MDP3646603.1 iron ABC transporter permease [Paracoccaceae bacterium]MDZ4065471.1 iron ABC transporter permease [Tabrizicola sp.]
MVDENTQVHAPARRAAMGVWSTGAVLIALIVLAPLASILWIAFHPTENIWPHLMATVLPRYLATTLTLMLGVAVLTAAAGTGAAWLVTMYRFPGRGWLSHALLFPLAIPAYVGAYALVDFLDYAGPLQTALRSGFGWASARDYWFPQTRSLWAAVLVLSAALYPYVYLLARAAFREQPGCTYHVARALGVGPWGLFLRVGLPMARPAIAAGVALALMETVADYGTVYHFGVQTLTTGIFSTWLNGSNAGGAAQIAGVVLVLIFLLVMLERIGRRNARFHAMNRSVRPIEPAALGGARGWLAFAACMVPFGIGFVLPVMVMAGNSLAAPEGWLAPGLGAALVNTLVVAGAASLATVGAALFLVYGVRMAGRGIARVVLPVTLLGYAAPGAVLALGLLIPLAALDHRLADAIEALTGHDPGLLITGTAFALGLAYLVRFFGIAQGALDAAFGRVSPSLPMAARSLGRTAGGALSSVYLPLMRGSVATALLVVFVDCVKELPATLLLRPFNYNTLSTRVFELASLERLSEAAPAALLVMAVGLAAVALLARANRD